MTRKKVSNPDDLLSHNLIIRVTETTFERLQKLQQESKSLSIAEVARRILSGRKINLYHHDVSMNPVMEELAMIRKELKAIGININQITRSFNQYRAETHRAFHVLKFADLYICVLKLFTTSRIWSRFLMLASSIPESAR